MFLYYIAQFNPFCLKILSYKLECQAGSSFLYSVVNVLKYFSNDIIFYLYEHTLQLSII